MQYRDESIEAWPSLGLGHWIVYWDVYWRRKYYYNTATNSSVWQRPDEVPAEALPTNRTVAKPSLGLYGFNNWGSESEAVLVDDEINEIEMAQESAHQKAAQGFNDDVRRAVGIFAKDTKGEPLFIGGASERDSDSKRGKSKDIDNNRVSIGEAGLVRFERCLRSL